MCFSFTCSWVSSFCSQPVSAERGGPQLVAAETAAGSGLRGAGGRGRSLLAGRQVGTGFHSPCPRAAALRASLGRPRGGADRHKRSGNKEVGALRPERRCRGASPWGFRSSVLCVDALSLWGPPTAAVLSPICGVDTSHEPGSRACEAAARPLHSGGDRGERTRAPATVLPLELRVQST